jgi:hypothetical protein
VEARREACDPPGEPPQLEPRRVCAGGVAGGDETGRAPAKASTRAGSQAAVGWLDSHVGVERRCAQVLGRAGEGAAVAGACAVGLPTAAAVTSGTPAPELSPLLRRGPGREAHPGVQCRRIHPGVAGSAPVQRRSVALSAADRPTCMAQWARDQSLH